MKALLVMMLSAGLLIGTPPATTIPVSSDTTVVYVTNTGSKYHLDGCRYLSRSKNRTTLGEAKRNGYTPCSVCKPPTQ